MRRVGLSQLTNRENQQVLQGLVAQGKIYGALARADRTLVVFGPGAELKDEREAIDAVPDAVKLWSTAAPMAPVRKQSRTQKAIELLAANPALSPHAAAQQAGVHVSAVYRQLERNAKRGCCAACGQLLPAVR